MADNTKCQTASLLLWCKREASQITTNLCGRFLVNVKRLFPARSFISIQFTVGKPAQDREGRSVTSGGRYPITALLICAGVAGIVLGSTSSIIFLLPAALMAFLIGAVLIVRPDIDVGLTALTATLFCGGYLVGVVMTNTRPRLFTRPLRDD